MNPENQNHSNGNQNSNGFVNNAEYGSHEANQKKKIIQRDGGKRRVKFKNIPDKRKLKIGDQFTCLVDAKWRYIILLVLLGFFLCWLFFSLIYYIIIVIHDKKYKYDDSNETESSSDLTNENVCITNIYGFTSIFLFSMESQHTIGYGYRYITENCPAAYIALCFQSIVGVVIQAYVVGIVIAKLSRPAKGVMSIIFSKNALINSRDGKLCLMFRVADVKKSFLAGTSIRSVLIEKTQEDEQDFTQKEVKLKLLNDDTNSPLLLWPITIIHEIDHKSPLYRLSSSSNIYHEEFELIVFLEGTSETTGGTLQARYSYSSTDILWSRTFANMIEYCPDQQHYIVDFLKFNSHIPKPITSASTTKENVRRDSSVISRF